MSEVANEPTFCIDTAVIAVDGACPVHGGDACLMTPLGVCSHLAQLAKLYAAKDAEIERLTSALKSIATIPDAELQSAAEADWPRKRARMALNKE